MAHYLSLSSGAPSSKATTPEELQQRLSEPEESEIIMFGTPRTSLDHSTSNRNSGTWTNGPTDISEVDDILGSDVSTPRPMSLADDPSTAMPRPSLDSVYSSMSYNSHVDDGEASYESHDSFLDSDTDDERLDPDRTPRATHLIKAVRSIGDTRGMGMPHAPRMMRSVTAPLRPRKFTTAPLNVRSVSSSQPRARGTSTAPQHFLDASQRPVAGPSSAKPSTTQAVTRSGWPGAEPHKVKPKKEYGDVGIGLGPVPSAMSLRSVRSFHNKPTTGKTLPPIGTTTPDKFPPLPPLPGPLTLREPTGSFAETRLKLQASKARLAQHHPVLAVTPEASTAVIGNTYNDAIAHTDGDETTSIAAEAMSTRARSQVLPTHMQPNMAGYAALLRELDNTYKDANLPAEAKEQVMALLRAVFQQVHAEGRVAGINAVRGGDSVPHTLRERRADGQVVRQRRRVSSMFSAVSEFPAFPPAVAQRVTDTIPEIEPETPLKPYMPSTPPTPATFTSATTAATDDTGHKSSRLRRLFRKDGKRSSGDTDTSVTATPASANPYMFPPNIPNLTPRPRPDLTIEVPPGRPQRPADLNISLPASAPLLESRWSQTTVNTAAGATDDGTWRAKAARIRGGLGLGWGRKDKDSDAGGSRHRAANDAHAEAVLEHALAAMGSPGKVRFDGTPIESTMGDAARAFPGDKENSAARGLIQQALAKLRSGSAAAPSAWDAAGPSSVSFAGFPTPYSPHSPTSPTSPTSTIRVAPTSAAHLYNFRPASARKVKTGDVSRPVPFAADTALASMYNESMRERERETQRERDNAPRGRFRSFAATRT